MTTPTSRTRPRAGPSAALLPVVLLAAAAAFPLGLWVPIVEIDRPLSNARYGVLGGIWAMLTGDLPLLALVVFCFSVVFPGAKLTALVYLWARPRRVASERVELLRRLGKWSMLDVYVVVILVGAIRLGVIADVVPRVGVWVFGGSVLGAMVATQLVARIHLAPTPVPAEARAAIRGWTARAVSLAALASFVAGLALPLMEVEKWVFWSNDYSILTSLGAVREVGGRGLVALVVAFVIALPLARLACLAAVRWSRAPAARLVRLALTLEDWAMADVFALALLVVVTKAARLASVEMRAGLWLLLASGLLAALDAALLRRALRAP